MDVEPAITTKRIKTTKVSVKEFVCKDCGSGFTRKANLYKHVQQQHRPATCGGCGARVVSMAEHECSSAKIRYFECQSCDYKSKRRRDVKRHWDGSHSAEARARIASRRSREFRSIMRQERKRAEVVATKRLADQKKKYLEAARKETRRRGRLVSSSKALLHMPCAICQEKFSSKLELSAHIELEHHPTNTPLAPGDSPDELYGLRGSAFGKRIAEYIKNYEPGVCADPFLLFVDDNSAEILSYHLAKSKIIKMHTQTKILMQHVSDDGNMVNYETFDFFTTPKKLYLEKDLHALSLDVFDELRRELFDRLSAMEMGSGSGWRIAHIQSNRIKINKVPHLYEGRLGQMKKRIDGYIQEKFFMPRLFENPPSRDGDCFYASIAQYYVGRDKLEKSGKKRLKDMGGKRVEIERFIKQNIQKNIGVPARVSRINQFEEAHKDTLNFKVNVFGHDGSKNSIFPLEL